MQITAETVERNEVGPSAPPEAQAPPRQADPRRHLPGEAGAWVFIFGDMLVFAMLFGAFLEARSHEPVVFEQSRELLNVSFGAVNTLLLLASSLCVVTGVRALRLGLPHLGSRLYAGALVCGFGFLVSKALEYGDKLSAGLTPATNDFWMYFFTLTGLHLFHLLIGMALLTYCLVRCRAGRPSDTQFTYIEGASSFWHMVDLLWIVLFPLLYLVQ